MLWTGWFLLHGITRFATGLCKGNKELYARPADLGSRKAHQHLADNYYEGGDLKKAKFHYEAAAMAGHEGARYNLGCMEAESRDMERDVKHWTMAASAGCFHAMGNLLIALKKNVT